MRATPCAAPRALPRLAAELVSLLWQLQGPRGELQRTFHPLVKLSQVRSVRGGGGGHVLAPTLLPRLAWRLLMYGMHIACMPGEHQPSAQRQQPRAATPGRGCSGSRGGMCSGAEQAVCTVLAPVCGHTHPPRPCPCRTQEDGVLRVARAEESRTANAQHGLARSLLSNMVVGVDTGFTRTLQVSGTWLAGCCGAARGAAPGGSWGPAPQRQERRQEPRRRRARMCRGLAPHRGPRPAPPRLTWPSHPRPHPADGGRGLQGGGQRLQPDAQRGAEPPCGDACAQGPGCQGGEEHDDRGAGGHN